MLIKKEITFSAPPLPKRYTKELPEGRCAPFVLRVLISAAASLIAKKILDV
jgi:hypothetical protein